MSSPTEYDQKEEELGKASRRASLLSLVGFVVVLLSIAYAMLELHTLEKDRASLLKQTSSLRIQIAEYQSSLSSVRADLYKSRASLSAARAAINAFHSGQLTEAVTLYDEALSSDPDNAYLQNLRAYTLFRLGNVAAALDGERKSVAADPAYAWGYFDLARFLCAASPPQIEQARTAATKAIQLRPGMRQIMTGDSEFQRVCMHHVP